jgi:hypothetical protein
MREVQLFLVFWLIIAWFSREICLREIVAEFLSRTINMKPAIKCQRL